MGSSHADTQLPAFTIVVPAYNAARTITSCVNSVLGQTVNQLELVVVDDGSTDDTGQLVARLDDPRIRILRQANAGLPAARNTGTKQARAPVTCYLDSDDLLLPNYLEVVHQSFSRDPAIDFVYTDAWTFDDRTRRVRRATTAQYQRPPRPAPNSARDLFRELLKRNFIIVPVAVRTDVIAAAGLFDETMTSAEDWEMWLRLSSAGHRATEAPGPLGLRRQHAEQMSSDTLRMIDNKLYALEKLAGGEHLSDADRGLVARSLGKTRQERDILTGSDPLRSAIRRGRNWLGGMRRRLDPSRGWYREPPPAVAAAFGDLRSI